MKPDLESYLRSWSLELSSRSNRVRQLIGEAHWLSDGHHKEELLRDFLSRYLPKEFDVLRGFIKPAMGADKCSPEVDILVTDARRSMPYFREGGVQIVHPSSVLAHLEVKSQFTSAYLQEAFVNIARTKRLTNSNISKASAWSGIVFFTVPPSRTPESIMRTIVDAIGKADASFRVRLDADGDIYKIFEHPQCIAIEDKFVIFIKTIDSEKPSKQKIQVRLFANDTLCLACALADLFGWISDTTKLGSTDVFQDVVDVVTFTSQIAETFEI